MEERIRPRALHLIRLIIKSKEQSLYEYRVRNSVSHQYRHVCRLDSKPMIFSLMLRLSKRSISFYYNLNTSWILEHITYINFE